MGRSRGFTLVEMMIVVCIIAVFAALAAPSVVSQVRDQRTVKSVQTVMNMFREARGRSLGRGAAMLVGFDANGAGPALFYTLESRDAQGVPFPECTGTNWGANPLAGQTATAPMLNNYYSATDGKPDAQFIATIYDAGTTITPGRLQICFSAKGRVFARTTLTGPWSPLTGRAEFTAQTMTFAGTLVGNPRTFYVSNVGTRML